MNQLQKIEKLLDEHFVPKEVWIGTDSTANRVEWALKRKKIKEEVASKRFNTFGDEFMVLAVLDNFDREDLTVDEIAERTGIERETVKNAASYLAQKNLIFEYNDGIRGMLYTMNAPQNN